MASMVAAVSPAPRILIVGGGLAGMAAAVGLASAGVAGLTEIMTGTYCEHFFFEDPHGYAVEIQRFRDPAVARLFEPR